MPHLRNVWFDGQQLSGSLAALGALENLTFLQASDTLVSGDLPESLCEIECTATNTNVTCSSETPSGCCGISSCGGGTPAQPANTSSMGECHPQ